jgi:hypothetical protein
MDKISQRQIAEKATDSVVNVHQLRDTAIAIHVAASIMATKLDKLERDLMRVLDLAGK